MILELLPDEIKAFLVRVEALGFRLCLVGGAVRDYFMTSQLTPDLDFEIRYKSHLSPEDWEKQVTLLRKSLRTMNAQAEELPYLITRVNLVGHDLEFSSPRLERNLPGNITHHHFTAKLSPNLVYAESFKRRDITINAIGMEMDFTNGEEKVIDPFNGRDDLQKKYLRHVDESFIHDHVRLFRIVRFECRFSGFSIHPDTLELLSYFNLQHFSLYHFKREIEKSGQGARFLNRLGQLIEISKIKTAPDLECFFQLKYPDELKTLDQVISYSIMKNSVAGLNLARIVNHSEKKSRELMSFLASLKTLKNLDNTELKKIAGQNLENNKEILREIKNLFEKKDYVYLLPFETCCFGWEELLSSDLPPVDQQHMAQASPESRSLIKYHKLLQQIMNV